MIKLLIASHKENKMPKNSIYLPVHVGKILQPSKDFGYQSDADGVNISFKNPYYCELTAIYWAWKNLNADYIGLAHYRRHFRYRKKRNDWDSILSTEEAEKLCKEYDLILPKKRHLYIETVYSHYNHTFDGEHFDRVREIIRNSTPEYLSFFDKHMKERTEHLFNMFIMKRTLFNSYCEWMFPILEKLEECYDLQNMDPFQARLVGRVSERLLDVWVAKHQLKYKEIDYIYFGKNNYKKKLIGVLMAKFFGKKYTKSF